MPLRFIQSVGKPPLFTPLHQLEISGAIRCNVKRGTLTASKAAQALLLLRRDLNMGVYAIPSLDWPRLFKRAHHLSRLHSRPLLARSLDLLHVACALELGVANFLSFDDRQRKVAKAENLLSQKGSMPPPDVSSGVRRLASALWGEGLAPRGGEVGPPSPARPGGVLSRSRRFRLTGKPVSARAEASLRTPEAPTHGEVVTSLREPPLPQ